MVGLTKNEHAAKAPEVVKHCRHRPLRGHDTVLDNVTTTNSALLYWRALRVLIVDDEQDVTVGLFARVGAWGHVEQMAHHGQAALILAADEQPDVVLLNLELSSLDGCHLARQLRRNPAQSDCFIIAFANQSDNARRRQCSASGIDLLLVESVAPSLLAVLLELEWIRMNRQRVAKGGVKH